jgi:hypothetical protein
MIKSTSDNTTPRWKRSAAKGVLIGVRLQAHQLKALDAWIDKQEASLTRPQAIRAMMETILHILSSKGPGEKPIGKTARSSRAAELAANTIEKLIDPSATSEERDQRRRRLTKGPPEFREHRVDLPKRKT